MARLLNRVTHQRTVSALGPQPIEYQAFREGAMLKQKAVGNIRKFGPTSIFRNAFRRIGASVVLVPIIISLVIGLGFVAQIAYADIVPPRPKPRPHPNPADELKQIRGDLKQEISGGAAIGGVLFVGFVKKNGRN